MIPPIDVGTCFADRPVMLRLGLHLYIAVSITGVAVLAQAPPRVTGAPDMVLSAQVMLDAAGFSPGEIDGRPGQNFTRALAAFQQSRGLRVASRPDQATMDRLREEFKQQSPLLSYTVTDADVAGAFQPEIPKDLVEQSKLASLDYRNPLEALAERFHASPALLQSLNAGQTFARAGEMILVPNVSSSAATPSRAEGVRIAVTKKTSALTVEDAKGRVLFFAPVTTGSQHDPLPLGRWSVTAVQQSPAFHYNPDLFWDANPTHSKARIAPGPNNPVGVAWIDINKPHYGIHGTPEPSTVGHVQSHGCVRMTNWDVQRVAAWVKRGTVVIFR
jgi:lipoprotein-anchoring transpeptidase ErfK/SrfK